jgi:hypothetical protein
MMGQYLAFMKAFPRPGGGGAHTAIFKAGCLGARAGLDTGTVIADVRKNMPAGSRQVPYSEVEQGVRAGFQAVAGGKPPAPRMSPRVAPGTLERLIREGKGAVEADIKARSPVPLDWPEWEAGWRVLEALYGSSEFVFIGDDGWAGRIGETIRPVGEWVALLKGCVKVPSPKILVNPLSGKPAPKKTGVGETLRGDACVAAYRFVVAEFDGIPIEDQVAFWMAVPHLPVAALIHSGKKSLHAWLRVDCVDQEEWETQVENLLFPGYLEPLGLDPACKNASRLSRMPGHRRADTGLVQRCLYLAPEGKAVAA